MSVGWKSWVYISKVVVLILNGVTENKSVRLWFLIKYTASIGYTI